MLALAKIDRPDRQVAAIDLILANSLTVEEALARIDQRPLKLTARWEKLTEKFTRLHESEQDRFFDLNEASVTRWVAKRGRK